MTKDDVRELIYREILEYHPQLLKDYMNGTEGTHFLYPRLNRNSCFFFYLCNINKHIMYICNVNYLRKYVSCSAIDQFRKHFAYLEENHGKSGPVIPPERKHVSLPR